MLSCSHSHRYSSIIDKKNNSLMCGSSLTSSYTANPIHWDSVVSIKNMERFNNTHLIAFSSGQPRLASIRTNRSGFYWNKTEWGGNGFSWTTCHLYLASCSFHQFVSKMWRWYMHAIKYWANDNLLHVLLSQNTSAYHQKYTDNVLAHWLVTNNKFLQWRFYRRGSEHKNLILGNILS